MSIKTFAAFDLFVAFVPLCPLWSSFGNNQYSTSHRNAKDAVCTGLALRSRAPCALDVAHRSSEEIDNNLCLFIYEKKNLPALELMTSRLNLAKEHEKGAGENWSTIFEILKNKQKNVLGPACGCCNDTELHECKKCLGGDIHDGIMNAYYSSKLKPVKKK